MFGYVTIYHKGLEKPELDRYQAYYCGLCRTLGRRYGHTGQLALSYDMAGKLVAKDVELTLIPYYAWAHRGEGDMEVWLPIDVSATSTQLQEAGVWEDNGVVKN